MNVSNLPVFSKHTVRVYVVDVSGDVYKSERVDVETDESGEFSVLFFFYFLNVEPNILPYLKFWSFDRRRGRIETRLTLLLSPTPKSFWSPAVSAWLG